MLAALRRAYHYQRDERWPRLLARRFAGQAVAELDRRSIYVLPTGFGIAYAGVAGALAFGGLNYNNNLMLAFAFLYIAAAGLGVLACFRNLDRLRFMGYSAVPVHAGQPMPVTLRFEAGDGRERRYVHAWLERGHVRHFDIPATGVRSLELDLGTSRRGLISPRPLCVEGRWPFALVECWSWLPLEQALLVWPALESDPPPLPPTRDGSASARQSGDQEFRSLRDYAPGDPQKHIAWRASAHRDQLLVRTFEQPDHGEILLDWNDTRDLATEARISRLASWCVIAEREGRRYGLTLPGARIEAADGSEHLAECLRLLALLPESP